MAKSLYPRLEAYLAAHPAIDWRNPAMISGLQTLVQIAAFGTAAYLWWFAGAGIWPAAGAFFIIQALGSWAVSAAEQRMRQGSRRKNPRAETVRSIVVDLRDFVENNSLDERMHPAVGRYLEMCAAEHAQIVALVHSENWKSKKRGKHWDEMRSRVEQASGQAMEDALFAASGGYRQRGVPRKRWAERVERDPGAEYVAEDFTEIIRSMRQLRTELETALDSPASAQASREIDATLARLRELAAAEEELDILKSQE